MVEEFAGKTGSDLPVPMSELVVGAFAMKLHAKSPLDGSWRGRPVAAVAICRRTLMVAGVHVTYNHFGTLGGVCI